MKRSIKPTDVAVSGTPATLATLAELKSYAGVSDTDHDATLTTQLARASEFIQGPFGVTKRCFTAHDLTANYAAADFDLFLPGGRVAGSRTAVIATTQLGTTSASELVSYHGKWYARFAPTLVAPVVLAWPSAHGRVPAVVKGACLDLAVGYWTAIEDDEVRSTAFESAARESLMREGWA